MVKIINTKPIILEKNSATNVAKIEIAKNL